MTCAAPGREPTADRRRLGLYCPGAGTGGPWRYVHSILAHLDPAEFEVTVYCDLAGDYEPRPWVKVVRLGLPPALPGGATPAPVPARRSRTLFSRVVPPAGRLWAGFAREAGRLARLIRRNPVDLFHTQNTGCEESPVAARLAGVRRVLGTFHVGSTFDLHRDRAGPRHRVLEAFSNRCLRTAISVSDATRRDWVRRTHVPADRVVTIHNGIDPDRFRRRHPKTEARRRLGLPVDAPVVGGIGRLDPAKGFADLIEAAARLRPEFPDLCVAIAGEGPLRAGLEAEAARLGVADRIRFLGFQPDVQLTLDAVDVFALSSHCEALPYALLEAMATGLPAVGAAVGGVPEVIVPGETGFLVAPRDPPGLAAGLRPLLTDPALRDRMGAAGRERVVRSFHERDMVRRTVGVYRELLDCHNSDWEVAS
jgi:glycosyltransferase involved in cell wall biosynthesis